MTTRTRKILISALVLAVLACIYFLFSPMESVWMPKCMVKTLTGLDCPSCGAQRAFHAALHGHFAEALRYNFFLLVGLPYLVAAVVASAGSGKVSQWVRSHLLCPPMLWLYVALYVAWMIIRNILGI